MEKVNSVGGRLFSVAEKVLFPLILLFYPLRHVCFGVEWWDTGYNYGNFLYMENMDSMWLFSTYLGHAFGNLLAKLPFGNYMMGMNLYTGLLVSLLALGGYYFFRKIVGLPSWVAFLGEVIAVSLCWCPTALLYNYLTYILMGAGVVCIYLALVREKKRYFIIAGFCLAVNVFVRFSNLADIALILGVWAYGIIQKRKLKEVALQTWYCILGYLAGLAAGLVYFAMRYGLSEYADAITRLFGMPSEASDYTIYSMVIYQLQNYQQNFYWLLYLLLFTALGVAGFAVLPERFIKIKKIGYICCVFLGFYYLMQRHNVFNMKYSTKQSVFQWAVFLLSATIIAGVVTIFNKKAQDRDKLICGLSILVILITPLGSNNHLYSAINNLFFVAPFTLWMLYRALCSLPVSVKPVRFPALTIHTFPAKAMICCMLFMLLVQSLGFGFGYVFSESDGGENLNTKIENNDILKGMYTDPERARVLGSLSAYVSQEELKGKEILLYGQIPALSYYLEMPFAITAWPDLRSYNYEIMERDLDGLTREIEAGTLEHPVVLLEVKYGTWLTGGEEALRELGITEAEIEAISNDRKFALLTSWMELYFYEEAFQNDKFVLFKDEKFN